MGTTDTMRGSESRTETIDVFVSYARADRPRVEALVAALEARGLDVWWDREILPIERFREAIDAALRQARCVLAVWSRNSVDSDWVLGEAGEARKERKLCAVLIEDVDLPIEHRQVQTFDLRTWDGDPSAPAWIEFADGLTHVLKGAVSRPKKPLLRPRWVASYTSLSALLLVAILRAFDLTGSALEVFEGLVQHLGLEIPPLVIQGTVLILAAVAIWFVRAKLWPPARWSLKGLAIAFPAAVLLISILVNWIGGVVHPFPDYVRGRVDVETRTDLRNLRAAILDRRGEEVTIGSGGIDDVTGQFHVTYRRVFYDRPRSVCLRKPGCADVVSPIPRTLLRTRGSLELRFSCEEEP